MSLSIQSFFNGKDSSTVVAVNEDRLYKGCCTLSGIVQINKESIMPCKHETMRVTHNPYYRVFCAIQSKRCSFLTHRNRMPSKRYLSATDWACSCNKVMRRCKFS